MTKKRGLLWWVVVSASLSAAPVFAQPATSFVYVRGATKTFTAQTTPGQTAALAVNVPNSHSIQLVVANAPTVCTYRLQGSNDGATWYDISAGDITCTTSVQSYEQNKPTMWVRGNLLTFTAAASTVSTNLANAINNDLAFTAVTVGATGNAITVAYVDGGAAVGETVAVAGSAITVTLRNVGGVLSTAAQVKAAIDGFPAAAALITVANKGGNNGSGVVAAMPALSLAGGNSSVTLYYAGK